MSKSSELKNISKMKKMFLTKSFMGPKVGYEKEAIDELHKALIALTSAIEDIEINRNNFVSSPDKLISYFQSSLYFMSSYALIMMNILHAESNKSPNNKSTNMEKSKRAKPRRSTASPIITKK